MFKKNSSSSLDESDLVIKDSFSFFSILIQNLFLQAIQTHIS
jgi:hypothetical protein